MAFAHTPAPSPLWRPNPDVWCFIAGLVLLAGSAGLAAWGFIALAFSL